MIAQTLFCASAALATLASAFIPDIRARETGTPEAGDLPPLSEECQGALEGLAPFYADLPTPPPALAAEGDATAAADPCAATSLVSDPAALSQWSSYSSAARSWYGAHSDAIDDALQTCSELTSYYASAVPMCTDGGGAADATPTATASEDGDDNNNSNGAAKPTKTSEPGDEETERPSSTDDSSSNSGATDDAKASSSPSPTPAAAPRETGMMAAAVAVVAVGVFAFNVL